MAERDYNAAVAALNSLQSNFSIIDAIRKAGMVQNEQAIPEMLVFAKRLGYQPSDFTKFRPIHIAGTKGKGSTSAFISSILFQYTKSKHPSAPKKVGLYTSPHLRSVRERIQINNSPISEPLFAKYFFEVWDRLSSTGDGSKPVYFRYLTLMAYHMYIQEGVESAVIECGIGGEYDSTNIFDEPSVTAVTALSIDHVGLLGGTIAEIAWHKAGVFKGGARALTVPQPEEAMKVLKERAAASHVELEIIEPIPAIQRGEVKLGLAGEFQKSNASLAVTTAAAHLRSIGITELPDASNNYQMPDEFVRGLAEVKWPGRCDLRKQGPISWCLDGAHTLDSIKVAGEWFAGVQDGISTSKPIPRILIFNQQTRDAPALATALHDTLSKALSSERPFTHCIFTTNVTFKDSGYKADLISINSNSQDVKVQKVQKELANVWSEIDPSAIVKTTATIEEAIEDAKVLAQRNGGEIMVLVTGSLHLVGGALEVLESGGVEAK
ncbi:FolC bifunctional protein [Tothia fuscella]|uniref:Folylpolyglutamate synthase n=1 Tax=Tothia fuscella TaxID=1048955 RepID=A0A9P4P0F4_9PEZI|nr:FolC bifunctional protein [Tothia fuscella]